MQTIDALTYNPRTLHKQTPIEKFIKKLIATGDFNAFSRQMLAYYHKIGVKDLKDIETRLNKVLARYKERYKDLINKAVIKIIEDYNHQQEKEDAENRENLAIIGGYVANGVSGKICKISYLISPNDDPSRLSSKEPLFGGSIGVLKKQIKKQIKKDLKDELKNFSYIRNWSVGVLTQYIATELRRIIPGQSFVWLRTKSIHERPEHLKRTGKMFRIDPVFFPRLNNEIPGELINCKCGMFFHGLKLTQEQIKKLENLGFYLRIKQNKKRG